MITIFIVLLMWVVWKMFVLGLKATWGITKFVCMVFLMPIFLIGLVCVGLLYLALPILAVAGLVVLFKGKAKL